VNVVTSVACVDDKLGESCNKLADEKRIVLTPYVQRKSLFGGRDGPCVKRMYFVHVYQICKKVALRLIAQDYLSISEHFC